MARGKGEGAIYKQADGLWAVSIELPPKDGKRRRKVIRSKDKATVLRRLTELKRELERAGDLPTASMTVAQWFDYWMREIATRTRRPKTVEAYRSVIKTKILPTIGNIRLDKLTPANIRKVTSAIEADSSSTYARNAHSVMSAAFKDAEREGRIPRNPVELVQAPRKSRTNLHALTLEEAGMLLESFSENPDSFMWATFLLTGARRGEILGLEWDRVTDVLELSWQLQRLPDGHAFPADFEYRHLTNGLYLTRPKSRAGWRIIPLVEPLRSILARWRDLADPNPYGLVFTRLLAGEPVPIDPDIATKMWPDVLQRAGIDKAVRLHDIRHTTVDLLYLAGVPEDVISEIVGHSNRAVTRGYKSRSMERALGGMKQLSSLLGYDQ